MALSTIPPWPEADANILAFTRARDGQMSSLFFCQFPALLFGRVTVPSFCSAPICAVVPQLFVAVARDRGSGLYPCGSRLVTVGRNLKVQKLPWGFSFDCECSDSAASPCPRRFRF